MPLYSDPYATEIALRKARGTPPQQWETVREVPSADPVQRKLDRIIAQNDEIIDLLRR